MTGLSPDEVLGHNWNEIFASPWEGYLPTPFGEWLNNKPEVLHHESELLTREGERYWVRWNSIPLRDTRGMIVGVASIGEDIAAATSVSIPSRVSGIRPAAHHGMLAVRAQEAR